MKKSQSKKMEFCQRCESIKPALATLSRRTNLYVCSDCAKEEEMIDSGQIEVTHTENVFLSKFGKKINPTREEIGIFIQRKRFERFGVIVENSRNGSDGKYMKKMKNKKVRVGLTFDGEFIFPYLSDNDCPNVKHVLETIKIFPHYKLGELQRWSGLDEQAFMIAVNWLSQYGLIYSNEVVLKSFIASECSIMGCIK